ncbi:MAG: SMC-Scp complex subunit ScpB [Candidatus Omnitrophica bacterium]|nr:SMC-Scp complex subunit ScpB [Candidatus Omnitrophota bacterium]
MAEDNVKAVIEALLFVSEAPLTLEQIKNVLSGALETSRIRDLLQELNNAYKDQNRGLRIIEVAGGFRLITPPELSPFLKKLYKQKRVERLSRPALETLAIIAYKQPVTRLEIESLRNVNIDGLVCTLSEKGFIRVAGVKKSPGRPKVYGTTKMFLEYFGLKSLEELPKMEDFAKLNALAELEVKDAAGEPAQKN